MSGTSQTRGLGWRGQAAAAVRARPRVVGLSLLKQTPVLALVVGAPGLAAVIEGETRLAAALLAPTALLAFLGVVSRSLDLEDDLRRIEAVATLALIFVLSALAAVPAFVTLGLSPLDALFEAASGITTTGLSVAEDAGSWPISGHFLRAWMQWCGGVVVAVAGVALLIDSARAARVMGSEAVDAGDVTASTRAKARLVLIGYASLTAGGILLSIPLFPGWWEGPMVVLAAVSTGGFAPRPTSLADYSLGAQSFAVMLSVLNSVSLLFYAAALRLGPRRALANGTVPVTLAILFGGTALYAALHLLIYGLDGAPLVPQLLNQISAQTTVGFSTTPVVPANPLVLLMIVAMVLGGDVGSTAGGIKTARTAMLARMVGLTFLRLRLPARAVSHLKIGERRADSEAILFSAAILVIYLLSTFIFWGALYGAGHPALPSLFDAVSALSAVGLSTGVIGPDLDGWLKGLTVFAMLLGRLEFFVLIALLLPSTWISRR